MKNRFIIRIFFLLLISVPLSLGAQENIFIGSKACGECHEQEYSNFMSYSKKAHSFESIKKMKSKLTPEEYRLCFECHTTGYGKKGGFISENKTPALKDAGCEVCHGPGSLHAESEDPELIKRDVTMESCSSCHNKDRIEAFDFRPLLFGGAH